MDVLTIVKLWALCGVAVFAAETAHNLLKYMLNAEFRQYVQSYKRRSEAGTPLWFWILILVAWPAVLWGILRAGLDGCTLNEWLARKIEAKEAAEAAERRKTLDMYQKRIVEWRQLIAAWEAQREALQDQLSDPASPPDFAGTMALTIHIAAGTAALRRLESEAEAIAKGKP